uniref:Phosphatidylglycerol/phosphatidylinositol transfer protein n=1 Tax=Anthurium amnicola TaxID=1678845 RepID=A0A1D1YWQ7_9ARAE
MLMLKNNFFFLLLIVLASAVPFYDDCITTNEVEEQLFIKEFPVNSITQTISDCSNEADLLQITYIHISPDPPLKGKELKIDALGNLREEVGQGSYIDVTVKLGLIRLLQKRFDLCEESQKVDKPCPLKRGRQTLSTTVNLPREIPPGKYNVEALVYTPDNRRVACLKAVAIFRP